MRLRIAVVAAMVALPTAATLQAQVLPPDLVDRAMRTDTQTERLRHLHDGRRLPLPEEHAIGITDWLTLRAVGYRSFNAGLAAARANQTGEALSAFASAIKSNPSDQQAHYALGLMYGRAGHYDQAKAEFQEALRLAPDYIEASEALTRTATLIEERQAEAFAGQH